MKDLVALLLFMVGSAAVGKNVIALLQHGEDFSLTYLIIGAICAVVGFILFLVDDNNKYNS